MHNKSQYCIIKVTIKGDDKMFDNYKVYEDGRIFSKLTEKELNGCVDTYGYRVFKLSVNGKRKIYKHHRVVATLFVPNPDNLPQVNHKDGNKLNNHKDNLEWVNAKNNIHHAHKNGLATNKHLKKKVMQICQSTQEVLGVFDSYREASKATGITETNISAVCRGYKPKNRPEARQTAGGFIWRTCND